MFSTRNILPTLAATLLLAAASSATPYHPTNYTNPLTVRLPALARTHKNLLPFLPKVAQNANSEGLTLFLCRTTASCVHPRLCIRLTKADDVKLCEDKPGTFCFCMPPTGPEPCKCSRDCVAGEVCAFGTNPPVPNMCMSEFIATRPDGFTIVPLCEGEKGPPQSGNDAGNGTTSGGSGGNGTTPNQEGNNNGTEKASDACVDASVLKDYSADELVFPSHRKRAVLCDRQGSCATRGHLVVFDGVGMMMGSYCDIVGGCVRRVIRVNSPRFRKGLRVESRTRGLAFTAFAARRETWIEEAVLAVVVKVGF